MVSNLTELSLDLSPPVVSRSDPDILTRLQIFDELDFEELRKVDDFISKLEDEVNKIQAFKPINKLKEEARKLGEKRKEGKLDEIGGVNLENDQCEKKSWMSSAQLWSPRGEDDQSHEWQVGKFRGGGGAFRSFKEDRKEEERALPGLSLVTPSLKTSAAVEPGPEKGGTGGIFPGSVYYTVVGQTGSAQRKLPFQTARKRRRCWSPELHRLFVDALEKLGGSQVATPKQIRELMQVEDLTNDEVKSHLQKYRLHVRKLPAASRTSPSSSNDIAMSQDRLDLGCSKVDILHSSSPEGPLHLGKSGKCNSTSIEDHDNDNDNTNDDSSDGQSWSLHHHM